MPEVINTVKTLNHPKKYHEGMFGKRKQDPFEALASSGAVDTAIETGTIGGFSKYEVTRAALQAATFSPSAMRSEIRKLSPEQRIIERNMLQAYLEETKNKPHPKEELKAKIADIISWADWG